MEDFQGKVLPCECKQRACKGAITQDEMYGVGRRYHTPTRLNLTGRAYRCTICGDIKGKREVYA